jgi:hypothetical protein
LLPRAAAAAQLVEISEGIFHTEATLKDMLLHRADDRRDVKLFRRLDLCGQCKA